MRKRAVACCPHTMTYAMHCGLRPCTGAASRLQSSAARRRYRIGSSHAGEHAASMHARALQAGN